MTAVRVEGAAPPDPITELRVAVHSTKMKALTVPGSEGAKGCLAQARRLFEHRVEHGPEVARRGIDDGEDFGGGSLLGKRLITFSFDFVALTLRFGEAPLKIIDGLLEIDQCARGHRAHLRPR